MSGAGSLRDSGEPEKARNEPGIPLVIAGAGTILGREGAGALFDRESTTLPAMWLTVSLPVSLFLLGFLLGGCSSLESVLEEARTGDSQTRAEALFELEARVRSLGPPTDGDPAPILADRKLLNEFLRERFEPEPDPVIRANIITVALHAEAECAEELLLAGINDRAMLVRQQAIHGMRQLQPKNLRELLTDRLRNDSSLIVRLEAAKAFRSVGDADWAEPLVRIIVDTTEDESLRYQAFHSARALTGAELPFAISDWEAWLEKNGG